VFTVWLSEFTNSLFFFMYIIIYVFGSWMTERVGT
jgi:hypothetical protein